MTDGKTFRIGVFRPGQPMVGSGTFIADAETTCSQKKCDRNCEWPFCSVEYYIFHRDERAKAKIEELKLLGHTLVEEDA